MQISQYLDGKLERIPSVLAISITLWGGELLKEVSPLYRNLIDPYVKILLDTAEERLTTPVTANSVDEELGSLEIGLLDGEAIYNFAQESTASVAKLRVALAAFIDSDRQTLTKQANSVDGAVEAEPLGELLALFDDLTFDDESSGDDAEEALTTAVVNSPANYKVSAYKTYRLTIDSVLKSLNRLAQDLVPQDLVSKDQLPQ